MIPEPLGAPDPNVGRRVEALGDSAVQAARERKIARQKDGTILYENPGLPVIPMHRLPTEK